MPVATCLRRVAGDDYLAEIDSEEFGGAVTYFFCQVAESTPDIVVRVALQLVEIAGDSIGDDAWRGAHTARVEVYEPRVELEFLADALPVVGVTEGGVQVCAQRLQPVSYTLREFRLYLDRRRSRGQPLDECTSLHLLEFLSEPSSLSTVCKPGNLPRERLWSQGADLCFNPTSTAVQKRRPAQGARPMRSSTLIPVALLALFTLPVVAQESVAIKTLPFSAARQAGKTLYVSGQVARTPEGEDVKTSVDAETRQVMDNLGRVLEANGYSFEDVVKATVYLESIEDYHEMNAAYASYFKEGDFPARACVGGVELVFGFKVEVSVIAWKE